MHAIRNTVVTVVLAWLAIHPLSACSNSSECSLGSVWYESEAEGACPSIWTRQGDTSIFSDSQTSCGVTATLDVTINGNQVTVDRTNSSDGNNCTYTGTLSDDCSSVNGTYTCTENNNLSGPWSATINGHAP